MQEALQHVNCCQRAFLVERDTSSGLSLALNLLEMNIEDPFVNYGIAGALKVFMTNCKEQTEMKSFSLQLVTKLTTDQPCWMKLRTLTCLNGALSSKTFVEIVQNNILFDHITVNWNCIMCCICNFDLELRNGKLGQKELCLYEFIRLSKKVVKLIFKSEKPEKIDILKDIINFSRIWNLMVKCKVPVFTKSVLKLLNSLFPYGDWSSLSLNVNVVFKQTAENIITFFDQHGFTVIRLGHGCGFTGISCRENSAVDKTELQLVILLTLKSIAIILSWKHSPEAGNFISADVCLKCLFELDLFVKLFKSPREKKQTLDWVYQMFEDQDDLWVESLVALLDIYNQVVLFREIDSLPTSLQTVINPHRQFLLFIKATDFNESVVIDLLTSPETCFLLYFNCYLKFMCSKWGWLISTVKQMTLEEENSDKFAKGNNPSGKLCTMNSEHEIPKQAAVEHDICLSSCGLTLVGLYDSDSSEEIISPGDQTQGIGDSINELSCFNSNYSSCETVDCLQENNDKYVSSESTGNLATTTPPESGISLNCSVNSNKVNDLPFSYSTCKRCKSKVNQQNTSDSDFDEKCNCNVMKTDKVSGSGDMLDLLMSCIVRVRMKVSKLWDSDLFPYNPKPLLVNIRKAEELFENDYI
ncbi:protein Lines homolog 1-like [Mytilus californianus]|uniref:protein Lines homolog 1-like n=1 Tax=Mytilus californianus TaxID=6549 RepID=UPI0022477B19|nr:protein Lines homolog 1-like [Mytilus californianus]